VRRRVLAIAALACLGAVSNASSITISDEALGSRTPNQTPAGESASVINGDFVITQVAPSPGSPNIGDGLNDTTSWSFDFGTDTNLVNGKILFSALLTLNLQTTFGIDTDSFTLAGLDAVGPVEIRSLAVGFDGQVSLDLLDYYSSADILAQLVGGVYGQLPVIYEDDSIVSFARLELTAVPEPGILALLGIGIAGISYQRRK
jgi:hypothetical protein